MKARVRRHWAAGIWCGPISGASSRVHSKSYGGPRYQGAGNHRLPLSEVRQALQQYDDTHGHLDESSWWNQMPRGLFLDVLHYHDEIEAAVAGEASGAPS